MGPRLSAKKTKKERGGILPGASEQTSAKISGGHPNPTSLPRLADHIYCAYKRRNPESNHAAQKWQSSRNRCIPAEALKVDIVTSVEMPYTLFIKIWKIKCGADGMEERIPHQA